MRWLPLLLCQCPPGLSFWLRAKGWGVSWGDKPILGSQTKTGDKNPSPCQGCSHLAHSWTLKPKRRLFQIPFTSFFSFKREAPQQLCSAHHRPAFPFVLTNRGSRTPKKELRAEWHLSFHFWGTSGRFKNWFMPAFCRQLRKHRGLLVPWCVYQGHHGWE